MMTRKKTICFALLLCALATSCKKSLDRSEYIKWVHDYDNGLHVKEIFSNFIFDLQYQPADYLAVLNNDMPTGKSQGLDHYTLKISMTDASTDVVSYDVHSQSEKQQRLYYFSYSFQQDLFLEKDGKRFPCLLFHSESTDLKKAKTFVLGFEGTDDGDTSGQTAFVIDSPMFSTLPIKIKVVKKDTPTLKI